MPLHPHLAGNDDTRGMPLHPHLLQPSLQPSLPLDSHTSHTTINDGHGNSNTPGGSSGTGNDGDTCSSTRVGVNGLHAIASACVGYVGADIAALAREAALHAVARMGRERQRRQREAEREAEGRRERWEARRAERREVRKEARGEARGGESEAGGGEDRIATEKDVNEDCEDGESGEDSEDSEDYDSECTDEDEHGDNYDDDDDDDDGGGGGGGGGGERGTRMVVTGADFEAAMRVVRASVLREGGAGALHGTAPTTWDDVGGLVEVKMRLKQVRL